MRLLALGALIFAVGGGPANAFAAERRLIVILDRSGSMDEMEKSVETGKEMRRIEFAWKDLRDQADAEIQRGTEGFKLFLVPFNRKPAAPFEPPEIAGSAEHIRRELDGAKQRFPPSGSTDIAWAVDRAALLLKEKRFDIRDDAEIQVLFYSDGEQTEPDGWDLSPAAVARRNQMVADALDRLGAIFAGLRKDTRNLSTRMVVRHWGPDPLRDVKLGPDTAKNLGLGKESMEGNLPRAKFVVTRIDGLKQQREGDKTLVVGGTVCASGNNVKSAAVRVSLNPPLAGAQEVLLTAGGTELKSPPFEFRIPDHALQGVAALTLTAKMERVETDDKRRKVDAIVDTVSAQLQVSELPKLQCVFPPGGQYHDAFKGLALGVHQDASLRLQWNPAAAKVPLTMSSYPNATVEVLRADGRPLGQSFTLDEVQKDAQSAELILRVTAKEAGQASQIPLLEFSGAKMDPVVIKADLRVALPLVRLEAVDVREIAYDAGNLAPFEVHAAVLTPGAGAAGRRVKLEIVNKKPGLKAALVAEGLQNGVVQLKAALPVGIRLEAANESVLKELKDGDLVLLAAPAEPGALSVQPEQVPLSYKFRARPFWKVEAFDSQDRNLKDLPRDRLKRNEERQWRVKFSWNEAAAGRKIGLPFPENGSLRIGEIAEMSSNVHQLEFSGEQPKTLFLKLKAVKAGVFKPKLEFGMEQTRLEIPLPEIEVFNAGVQATFEPKAVRLVPGQEIEFGSLRLEGDRDSSGEKFNVALTVPAGCLAWLDTLEGAKWREAGGSALASERDFIIPEGPAKPHTFVLRGIVTQTYLDRNQPQAGVRWPVPDLTVSREGENLPVAKCTDIEAVMPAFELGTDAGKSGRTIAKGQKLALPHVFNDRTQPPLKSAYWQSGAGVEGIEVVLESPDPNFSLAFEATGTARMSLLDLYNKPSANITVTFNGQQPLVGEQKKTISPKVSLRFADGNGGAGVPARENKPVMSIVCDEKLNFRIPPLIHPAIIALVSLALVILVIVVVLSRGKQTASTSTDAAPLAVPAAPSEAGTASPRAGTEASPTSPPAAAGPEPDATPPSEQATDDDNLRDRL